ncbi:MSHA biogenesis protein MshP [uncultured Paraglaciecola sp.]|uniref:MSHA biogenesis protein MshP n=1 Tax=uncultured Paraglaciecola sp. TaxID=1765024 RepID=UPI0026157E92|nr:MSHA biogenesis protein MshP [uncultured Paraglaciecola sp.]
MSLELNSTHLLVRHSCQKGSMLVIALFVIIVFALLGLTMTRLLSASSNTIIHEVLGQRALNAARAGVECAVANEFGAGCSHPNLRVFDGVAGLEGCEYSAAMNGPKTIVDGAKNLTYWTFSSTGKCKAGSTVVNRTVYVDGIQDD